MPCVFPQTQALVDPYADMPRLHPLPAKRPLAKRNHTVQKHLWGLLKGEVATRRHQLQGSIFEGVGCRRCMDRGGIPILSPCQDQSRQRPEGLVEALDMVRLDFPQPVGHLQSIEVTTVCQIFFPPAFLGGNSGVWLSNRENKTSQQKLGRADLGG